MTSTAILVTTSSDPYVDASTIVCLLQMDQMGVLLLYTNTPVTDLLVMRSCGQSVSTCMVMHTGLHLDSGVL